MDQGILASPRLLDIVVLPLIDNEVPTTFAPDRGFPLASKTSRSGLEQPARTNADAATNKRSLMERENFMDNCDSATASRISAAGVCRPFFASCSLSASACQTLNP